MIADRICRAVGALAVVAVFAGATAAGAETLPRYEEAECWFVVPQDQKAECGFMTVAEDHTKPEGRTVRLPVVVIKASSGKSKADPIVFLTGGPGQPIGADKDGIKDWWLFADFWPWMKTRDLILFEQRGNGMSEPSLNCAEADARGMDMLRSLEDTAKVQKIYAEAIAACRNRLIGEGIDLNLYGTRETVKDLTDLRHLLGIKQWNLHGVSYGTRLALSAMRDAPEGVRSVILDSPYPPEVHAYEVQAAGVELAFQKLFEACAKNSYCRRRYPNLERAIFEQIDWLNIRPLPVTVTDPRNGEPVTIHVTGKALVEITRWALAFTDARYALPHYLAAISAVDPAVLEPAVRGMVDGYLGLGSGDMSEGKYYAVECVEEIPFNDPVLVRELEKKHHRFAGFGYKLDELSACEAWPKVTPDASLKAPIKSSIPTLVLSGELDPITPVEYGQMTASRLDHSFLIEVPGLGHSLLSNSECAVEIAEDFLDNPRKKPSEACLKKGQD
ncbi:MAG: alpha/beta fold hydrolase [Dongiaceae bacterium]